MVLDFNTKKDDIIEIIPSHYVPDLQIGNIYVVIDEGDGFDVVVLEETGEIKHVCGEDYKRIGNVKEAVSKLKTINNKEE